MRRLRLYGTIMLCAPVVEATVGVLLIAGVLPRVVILFMWLPFNVTIPLLPPDELLGNLPILAVMYAGFPQGTGKAATAGVPPVGQLLGAPA